MTKLSVSLIRGYQKYISPIFPPTCRYYPSCSHYTIQALEKHGTLKGSAMGFARILRCNPFVEGGYDHVPDYFTLKRNPDSQLSTQELSNEELVDLLLNDYETELVYNEASLATTLSEILSTEKIDNPELSQSYLSEIAQYTEAMGAYNHDFQLLKVTAFKDESYRHQGDDSGLDQALDQALDHAEGTYLITHSHLGVLAASNDQLALDLVLSFGVSEQDVRERTPRLLHYLRVLDQMQV